MGAELFYADGRIDGRTDRHDEAKAAVRSFANTPKTENAKWQECTQQGIGKEGVWPEPRLQAPGMARVTYPTTNS